MSKDRDWIDKAVEKPGAFRKKADKKGVSTSEFASQVMKNPDEYDEKTVKQARLAATLLKLRKRKKPAE